MPSNPKAIYWWLIRLPLFSHHFPVTFQTVRLGLNCWYCAEHIESSPSFLTPSLVYDHRYMMMQQILTPVTCQSYHLNQPMESTVLGHMTCVTQTMRWMSFLSLTSRSSKCTTWEHRKAITRLRRLLWRPNSHQTDGGGHTPSPMVSWEQWHIKQWLQGALIVLFVSLTSSRREYSWFSQTLIRVYFWPKSRTKL